MNRRMVIRDEASRQAAIRFIAGASIAGALDVAISAHKPSRSRDQNALYWQWMTVLAAETGHSKDEMHGMLKKRLMLPLMLEYPERYTKAVDANELLGAMPHKWRAIAELISTTDWPPSMPEFRKLCEPSESDFGLPSQERAYRAACQLNWKLHPAVYHAAKIVGTWELEQKPEYITRPLFAKAWAEVVLKIRNGEQLEAPINAPRIERSKESKSANAAAHLSKIRQMLQGTMQSANG